VGLFYNAPEPTRGTSFQSSYNQFVLSHEFFNARVQNELIGTPFKTPPAGEISSLSLSAVIFARNTKELQLIYQVQCQITQQAKYAMAPHLN